MSKTLTDRYGVVYFIGCGETGPVKIGFTADRNVTPRLKQLQTGSHDELIVLGAIDAEPAAERAIQRILEPHLVRGEWFEREVALALLARLKERSNYHTGDFMLRLSSVEPEWDGNNKKPLEVKVAQDIIWDIAHELQTVNTEIPLPFRAWLIAQKDRDDPTGDLAKDVLRSPEFPTIGKLEDYLLYITERAERASNPAVTRAVLEAWIECDYDLCGLPYISPLDES